MIKPSEYRDIYYAISNGIDIGLSAESVLNEMIADMEKGHISTEEYNLLFGFFMECDQKSGTHIVSTRFTQEYTEHTMKGVVKMYSITYPHLIQAWTEGFASDEPFTLSPQFFSYSDEQNHEDAAGLMRYVFEEALGWTPYDVQNYCSKEVIDIFGLRPAYRALMWPCTYDVNGKRIPLIDSRSGYGYVAALLYPNVIHTLGKQKLWIMEYNAMMSGHSQRKFRVDDFLGNDGYDHARLLLNHYLVNNPDDRFESIDDVYQLFANRKSAEKLLKRAKLLIVQQALFKSPLEYLHASLPDDGSESGRDHLSYDFYCFDKMFHEADSVDKCKSEIIERYRKNGESIYEISKSLDFDENLIQHKVNLWNESIADHYKDNIISLHHKRVPLDKIAEKSKLPRELIVQKLKEWGEGK